MHIVLKIFDTLRCVCMTYMPVSMEVGELILQEADL